MLNRDIFDALLRNDQKIQAIKLVRSICQDCASPVHIGLKESKDYCDGYRDSVACQFVHARLNFPASAFTQTDFKEYIGKYLQPVHVPTTPVAPLISASVTSGSRQYTIQGASVAEFREWIKLF